MNIYEIIIHDNDLEILFEEEDHDLTIDRNAFETWVEEEGCREYCGAVSVNGEAHEISGSASWEDYYNGERVAKDVLTYLSKIQTNQAA